MADRPTITDEQLQVWRKESRAPCASARESFLVDEVIKLQQELREQAGTLAMQVQLTKNAHEQYAEEVAGLREEVAEAAGYITKYHLAADRRNQQLAAAVARYESLRDAVCRLFQQEGPPDYDDLRDTLLVQDKSAFDAATKPADPKPCARCRGRRWVALDDYNQEAPCSDCNPEGTVT